MSCRLEMTALGSCGLKWRAAHAGERIGGGCPAELHLLTKHLIETGADFFVSQEFPSVQLVQSSCHLLAEPCVMVDVVFHKLLHVFLCTALVLGGGPLHFRLELGRKMHFHNFLD